MKIQKKNFIFFLGGGDRVGGGGQGECGRRSEAWGWVVEEVGSSCSNFALLNDHFQFLWSFNVNLNSNLRNIFMIILYFLDLPVEMVKF